MSNVKAFELYKAYVSEEILNKWNNIVSVWNVPKNPPDGGRVVDEIKEPVEVTALDEQQEQSGLKRKLTKITYGKEQEGWVLSDALTAKT